MKTAAHHHPIASISDLCFPRALEESRAILTTPGLELTFNARSALFIACQEIAKRGNKQILLPAFHCPSGVTPAIQAGLEPVFYRIRRDLTIDYEDVAAKASSQTGAIIVIHLFGIAVDLRPFQALRKRGVALIEDWSHSFLEGNPVKISGGNDSDYRAYSFWKLVPSGVGGGLLRNGTNTIKPITHPQPPIKKQIVLFKQILEEALDHSPYHTTRAVFQALEKLRLALRLTPKLIPPSADNNDIPGENRYPFDFRLSRFDMPAFSRRLIEASDLNSIARKRRDNFLRYSRLLPDIEGTSVPYKQLPQQACPWVFPIMLENRNTIDYRWRQQNVALHTFGIYLHSQLFKSTDHKTISDAQYISDRLLCLSIHQDIEPTEVDRSVDTIVRFMTNRDKQ